MIIILLLLLLAAGAVFAIQNMVAVTVTLLQWHFETSLAIAMLAALAVGVIVTLLASTPAWLRGRWQVRRQKQRILQLEEERANLRQRSDAPVSPVENPPAEDAEKPPAYAGLKTLLVGADARRHEQEREN